MIFSWFLISFVCMRLFVILMSVKILPNIAVMISGIHVHHLNFGIIILCIVGFISLAFRQFTEEHIHGLSILYGIGLGITFDEFAMWFLLDEVYWERITYDAFIVICLIFLNIIYFRGFWVYAVKKLRQRQNPQLYLFRKK